MSLLHVCVCMDSRVCVKLWYWPDLRVLFRSSGNNPSTDGHNPKGCVFLHICVYCKLLSKCAARLIKHVSGYWAWTVQHINFPRCAFVHVLEEMKSLHCLCHNLAVRSKPCQPRDCEKKTKKGCGWQINDMSLSMGGTSYSAMYCRTTANKSHILQPGDKWVT